MLGRDPIGDRAGLVQVAHPDQRAARAERRGDDVLARHRRQLPRHACRDRVEEVRIGRDEDRLRVLVVLGLREKIHRDPVRVGARVGDDENFRRPGNHVDTDRAEDPALSRCNIGIARADDLVDGGNRPRAVGERRDRLRAADREGARDARKMRGGEDQRIPRPVRHGRNHDDLGHARDLGRQRVHQHRRRVRSLAARNVQPHAVERGDLLPQARAVSLGHRPRLAPLPFVKRADTLRCRHERVALPGRQAFERGTAFGRGKLERGDAHRADAIEARGVFEHRGVAAGPHVGEDPSDRGLDGRVLLGVELGQPRQRRVEIRCRGVEPPGRLLRHRPSPPPRRRSPGAAAACSRA